MTYLGSAVTQLDGTYYAHSNCVAACTSVLGDSDSLGYWNIKPATIRKLTGDTSGGLTYTDSVAALKRATLNQVSLTVIYNAPLSALDAALDAPRIVAISISAAVTRYTPYNTGTYTGKHNVAVGAKRYVTVTRADGTKYQQKQAYVMDPGHSDAKWVWWPWSLLVKAALASTGTTDKIHLYYTRDVQNVQRKVMASGAIRSTPAATTTNRVGSVTKDQILTVLDTVRGGSWGSTTANPGSGWSKIGTNKYVNGASLR